MADISVDEIDDVVDFNANEDQQQQLQEQKQELRQKIVELEDKIGLIDVALADEENAQQKLERHRKSQQQKQQLENQKKFMNLHLQREMDKFKEDDSES